MEKYLRTGMLQFIKTIRFKLLLILIFLIAGALGLFIFYSFDKKDSVDLFENDSTEIESSNKIYHY